jgi:type I restriction enzyme S subunit
MRTTMATENNNKTLNVPNLRFPEFGGEWTRTLLNNYLEENKERNKRGIFTKNHVLSVSGDFGIVNQIELLGRSFAGKSVLDYHVVRTGNVVYTKSPLKEYPYGIVKVNGGVDGIVSTLYAVYKVKETANGKFVEYYFGLPNRTNRYFKPIVRIGAKHDMKIGNDEVLANYVVFPCVDEQKRISDFICLLDERIATQIKIIEDLKKLKSAIRTKVFKQLESNCECWTEIGNMLQYEQPSKYLVASTEYSDSYATPVLTANKAFILGYTDEEFGIYSKGECVIFDDFTMDVKFVNFPFKVKSSAIKILTANSGNDLYFVYEYLQNLGLVSEEHKRHYISEIEPMIVACPTFEEQQNISNLLRSFDSKIECANRELTLYNKQKHYLLSQMFI